MPKKPKRESAEPFGDLRVQLPGRLAALEILVALLLRELLERPHLDAVLRAADDIIGRYESAVTADRIGEEGDYALKVFAAAREALDWHGRNARGLPRRGT